MGQCSTLPADKNKPDNGRNATMSPTTSQSSRRVHKQQREERDDSYHGGDDRRHTDGDVMMAEQPYNSHRDVNRMAGVVPEGTQKFDQYMKDDAENAGHPGRYHTGNSSRSSSRMSRSAAPVVGRREEYIPLPEGSVKTRCYRLNLDVPVVLSPTHDSLGPFHYRTPCHLRPETRLISHSVSEESVEKTQTQIAVDTARIFRGIKVDSNGTIVGRNDRASRSRKGSSGTKTAENSRQSAKINKANDLVDDLAAGGKENSGEKQNLVSIFPMGEYDEMKQLVRDGSKKLRDAKDLPDENILSLNRHRGSPQSRRSSAEYLSSPSSSSRRRLASYQQEGPGTPSSAGSTSRLRSKIRRPMPSSVPIKLKSHPRDRASSRRIVQGADERNPRPNEKCNNIGIFGGGDSDWSEALNFNSIWTCGANGSSTMSPTSGKKELSGGRMPSQARYEGRNESSTRFSRGASERDAPLIL